VIPSVRIVTDSTADLPPELAAALGITVVPLQVAFGNEVYRDGVDLTPEQFYAKLPGSPVMPKTSQPSVGTFEAVYERLCRDTDSILSIHISSSLSGTCGSAVIARDTFRNRCNIEVVDSRLASMGLGLVVLECARLARDGASLRELDHHAKRMIPNVHILFAVETLEYLQRGGRIGRAQALVGSLLSIKPLLKIEEGEVRPVEKVRTRLKALDRLVEFVELFADVKQLAVVHAAATDDVQTFLKRIEPLVPREKVLVSQMGPVVGTHVGPGTIGVVASQGVEG
jgi:DegV family protein with EDD domain